MALVHTHGRCCACNQYSDVLIDLPEANSPEGESSAIACSGAGCPDNEGIRGVPGPGEILAKLQTLLNEELDSHGDEPGLNFITVPRDVFVEDMLRHLSRLLGV